MADTPGPDPGGTYLDVFCDCHRNADPAVLENGTDIAWPAGWTAMQAEEWRELHSLVKRRTKLSESFSNGEIEIITEDSIVMSRATDARHNPKLSTFSYWNGEDYATVTGWVTSVRPDGAQFRFSVMPALPPPSFG